MTQAQLALEEEFNARLSYMQEAYGPTADDCHQMGLDDLIEQEAEGIAWAASPEGIAWKAGEKARKAARKILNDACLF